MPLVKLCNENWDKKKTGKERYSNHEYNWSKEINKLGM